MCILNQNSQYRQARHSVLTNSFHPRNQKTLETALNSVIPESFKKKKKSGQRDTGKTCDMLLCW